MTNRILEDKINNILLLKHIISSVEAPKWKKTVSNKTKNNINNNYILQVNFLTKDYLFKRRMIIDHIYINVRTHSQKNMKIFIKNVN